MNWTIRNGIDLRRLPPLQFVPDVSVGAGARVPVRGDPLLVLLIRPERPELDIVAVAQFLNV
ncbi:hypothetical protein BRC89_07895 [Halobacteriales archaeon QS_4_70_19]|nr:MAG: hypothetical protein BRC89_07895 [Halobacteriales archaeon QS_4_70_19]